MDLTTVYIVSFGLIILVTGYFLPAIQSKSIARLAAWGISVLSVVFATVITGQASALYRMVAIISLQLLSMKSIVAVETYTGKPRLTFIQWLAFALGWFGMRPVLFEKFPSTTLSYGDILVRGVTRIIVGVLLVYLSFQIPKLFVKIYFLEELILLVGFSLILHFGILNVSTALWRISGVDVRELFRAPYKSRSLKEFWGKRWNLAFSEMTALIAYKPLKRFGVTTAMLASFLLSGILHEIAISFPVKAGYGMPMLYFTLHGILMYLENKSLIVQKIIAHRIASHIWVLGWLVIPMPLLFHTSFIEQVMKPLREILLRIV